VGYVGDIETNTDTPACWSSSNACQRIIGGDTITSFRPTSREFPDLPDVVLLFLAVLISERTRLFGVLDADHVALAEIVVVERVVDLAVRPHSDHVADATGQLDDGRIILAAVGREFPNLTDE